MKHWIIRCKDGINFYNSKYPYWGVKIRDKNMVKKFTKGDILWFLTSKNFGGKIIAMVKFTHFYDRKEEPLIQLNTLDNKEQNWDGEDVYDIQIYYKNIYDTRKQKLDLIIQSQQNIIDFDNYKDKIDLDLHYKNFIFYANKIKI